MTQYLFGRVATLFAGVPGEQGLDFSGLRFAFDVTKSNEPTANAAKIQIFNLSQDSRTFLETDGVQVLLSAGYSPSNENDQLRGVFRGDIIRLETVKKGGDLITTVECGDSIKTLSSAKVNLALKPGAKLRTLLNEVTTALGVQQGEIQGVDGEQFLRGFSANGKASEQLDLIADKAGAQWSIHDGVLQIIKPNGFLPENAVLTSPETGLIGSPNKKVDKNGSVNIQFRTLLNPELLPNRRVSVESRFVSGVYKVTKVTYRGDTRSGDWFCDVEAS